MARSTLKVTKRKRNDQKGVKKRRIEEQEEDKEENNERDRKTAVDLLPGMPIIIKASIERP